MTNDDAKLDRVLELRAEADALHLPYARYVAERMSYSEAHVRKLAQRARERE